MPGRGLSAAAAAAGTAPGWPRAQPRSGRGSRSRVGTPRPTPAPGNRRGLRGRPRSPPRSRSLTLRRPVPSRAVPPAGGRLGLFFRGAGVDLAPRSGGDGLQRGLCHARPFALYSPFPSPPLPAGKKKKKEEKQ